MGEDFDMPLLDHFHAPLAARRHWESFHSMWCGAIAGRLNQGVLPPGYFAETQQQLGTQVEIDVPTFHEEGPGATPPPNGGVAVQTWAPPAVELIMPAVFPDSFEVLVFDSFGGATLVGAVELASPSNKDRPDTRRAFAAKCASYLHAGVGLVMIDVVTERLANLHDELIRLLEQGEAFRFRHDSTLYAVAYRPTRRQKRDEIEMWQYPLVLGQTLPTVPLALRRGPTLPLELETTYTEARARLRL
jgi:hypothetical protein